MKAAIKSLPGYQTLRKLWKPKNARQSLLHQMPKNSIGAEIGVDQGSFSQQILEIVKPKKLHLIDPWEYQEEEVYQVARYGAKGGKNQENMNTRYQNVVNKFSAEIASGQIVIHRDYSTNICSHFDDNYFDWIYIDGNHLYEFVKQDLELYYRTVKKGGFITGDDYTEGGWWQGGVKKAVDEFISKGVVRVIWLRDGQFLLKKN